MSDVFWHRSRTGKSYCRTRSDVGSERVNPQEIHCFKWEFYVWFAWLFQERIPQIKQAMSVFSVLWHQMFSIFHLFHAVPYMCEPLFRFEGHIANLLQWNPHLCRDQFKLMEYWEFKIWTFCSAGTTWYLHVNGKKKSSHTHTVITLWGLTQYHDSWILTSDSLIHFKLKT
jgi:hypothetical protein